MNTNDFQVLTNSLQESAEFTSKLNELATRLGFSTDHAGYELARKALGGDAEARRACAERIVLEEEDE